MRILILGGTRFLGRHLVEAALAKGHEITLFNRGRTNPNLYPQVEKLHGDRQVDLSPLKGRCWDAVLDTSGNIPRVVNASSELLSDAVETYTFISSISAYADFHKIGITETYQTGRLKDDSSEELTDENYGPLKVLCEMAVEDHLPGRTLVVRPGLIVGPYDPTDRFTYWPVRINRGGEVLAPGKPDQPIQFIDARDLSEWIIRMTETRQVGIYNATGPNSLLTMGEFLEACQAASAEESTLTWADAAFLLSNSIEPWSDMPMWLPGEEYAGMQQVDISKALDNGLAFRALIDTIGDTIAWAATRSHDHQWRAGITLQREAELLREWHTIIRH